MWFELKGDKRLCRCTTENCGGQPTWRLESGGIGSDYCSGCKDNIDHLCDHERHAEFERHERQRNESAEMSEHFRRHPHG